MNPEILRKIIFSCVAILITLFFSDICKRAAKKTQQARNMQQSRYFAFKRLISTMAFFVVIVVIVFVWGINIKNLWVSITGVLAMIAVAFFAVWSLVGNILAGIIIYFTTPFKINDVIEVMPDEIKGKVLTINTFYTVLLDEEENYINVPNSLFFQKYIKKVKKSR